MDVRPYISAIAHKLCAECYISQVQSFGEDFVGSVSLVENYLLREPVDSGAFTKSSGVPRDLASTSLPDLDGGFWVKNRESL